MSNNISREKRDILVNKISDLRSFLIKNRQDNDNVDQLLKYLSDLETEICAKKFGIVFEEHKENIDDKMRDYLPVLIEDETKYFGNAGIVHSLIEGDNLASLDILRRTLKGKIDCIYIDPPYNTGTTDFIYDDKYISSEDLFRHSKWLSFMQKRLMVARELMSSEGVMFISIDDHEFPYLNILCQEIFNESNVETMIWRKSGVSRDGKMKNTKTFRIDHEYIIVCYKGQKNLNKLNEIPHYEKEYGNPDNDHRGDWLSGSISRSEAASKPTSENYYSVISPSGTVITRQFEVSKEEFDKLNNDGRIYWGKKGDSVPRKKIFLNEEKPVTPYSILLNQGTTTEGTKELNSILGGDYSSIRPKPSSLIQTLIQIGSKKNSIVLDFFAGSGTTGQAVMQLNNKDKGSRRFILCTNNQNDICENITYQRLKEYMKNNQCIDCLKYYKMDFEHTANMFYYEYADKLLTNIKNMVELENGIDFKATESCVFIATDEELDDFIKSLDSIGSVKMVYVGHDVLISKNDEDVLTEHGIMLNIIPDYYYGERV